MNRKHIWISVFGPLLLGVAAVSVFLLTYFNKNKALVWVYNHSEMAMQGGQLHISSQDKDQEIGELRAGDSTLLRFEGFSDGHYIFTALFNSGVTFKDSGGYVTHGMSYKDKIILENAGDSIQARFIQSQP